ncbi:MAG: CHY zinc finger protein [Pyrinomonadaceae bacterium]
MKRTILGEDVHGVNIDLQTRCAHWHGHLDIIAIKFKCCGEWFPCFDCHAAEAGHAATVWPKEERNAIAVLCGACGGQLTISEYLDCGSKCPKCASRFNPGCANHLHLYFE